MSAATVAGQATSLRDAVSAAAALLLAARRPLVTGLAASSTEAQRRAVELTELIGGVIDPAGSAAHAAGTRAFQSLGQLTATLGEARTRAELLVFWGIDPEVVEPGFMERYLAPAPEAPPRSLLAVDVGDACGPAGVAERLVVDPAVEVELLWALRASLKGRRIEPPVGGELPGWPAERILGLVRRVRECRYGIIFFDAEPPPGRRDRLRPFALGALAMEANPGAHLRLIGLRRSANGTGAESVLVWQTGYPSAVDFARGYPRYGPGEYDVEHALAAGEVDAVLLLGAPDPSLPAAAREALSQLPVVLIGAPGQLDVDMRVTIGTSSPETTPGSVYRVDGIAVRRRAPAGSAPAPAGSGLPTEEEVLAALVEAARVARRGGGA